MRISDWSSDVGSSDLPLGLKHLFGHPRCSRPDLVLRLKVDPLRRQRARVVPRVNIQLGKALVHMVGPRLAPLLQERRAVPLDYLLAEAVRADFTHRQHDMRVRLGLPVLAHVPMPIEVRHHPELDELLFDELAAELEPLLLVQLARNRELDFPGKLRVLALLDRKSTRLNSSHHSASPPPSSSSPALPTLPLRLSPPFLTCRPQPSRLIPRVYNLTCAGCLGWPSLAMSDCTVRSAAMPRSTNCFATRSRASWTPGCWCSSGGIENSTSRASCASSRF